MVKAKFSLYFLFISFFISHNSSAQSCCSGGVPLSGNLGLPLSDQKTWQFSVNYDLNVLNTLKDGTTTLEDNTRKRTTHSVLGQVGYTINDRFSLEGFFSFVRQERRITPIAQSSTFTSTEGIGDLVLLAKYRIFKGVQVGFGVKVPTGASDKTNELGIPLNADLQPGSGAWDLIYWLGGSQTLEGRPSMTIIGSFIYRSTGRNNNYLGRQIYQFGNETQANIGIADRLTIGTVILDPSLSIRYRHVDPDRNKADVITDIRDVPSTGGEWIFVNPGLTYNLSQDISFQANVQIPIYAKLVNTQVTPTYRLNVGATFLLRPKQDNLQKNEIN